MKRTTLPYIVISLGGSLVVPDGIDTNFLKKFYRLIETRIKKGDRFILIVGGGKTARRYQHAAKEVTRLTPEDIDWLGIHATRLNGHLLRTIFRKYAHLQIITSKEKINTRIRKPVIIAAGFRPGGSTDLRAVQLAYAYGASTVINLSNISWVYTKDPNKYKNAKKLKRVSWTDFRKIVGNKWNPGANTPFDPVASKWAQTWKKRVIITKGTDMKNVKNLLDGKRARGTIIQ